MMDRTYLVRIVQEYRIDAERFSDSWVHSSMLEKLLLANGAQSISEEVRVKEEFEVI
jgi:hypothetical protein